MQHAKKTESEQTDSTKWEAKLFKQVVLARYIVLYDESADGKTMKSLFEKVPLWSWLPHPTCNYVPGGPENSLREWPDEALACAPVVCQLCSYACNSFWKLLKHISQEHRSYAEYRKKVLFLVCQRGPQKLKASEKRHMVQSFCHHESTSTIGSLSNNWPMSMQNKTVPREEAACVICARLNWLENRIPVRLFACEKSQTPQAAIQTVAAVSMTHLILQSSHRKKPILPSHYN